VFGAQQVVDPHDRAGRLSDPLPAPSSPASGNPSGGPLPQAGASWTYRVRDQQFRRDQRFTVQVASVQNLVVTESIDADGTSLPGIVDARRLRFVERRVAGRPIVELSPYLLNSGQGPSAGVGDAPADYPTGSAPERFRVRVVKAERERVVVPAGAFNALKVEVAGEREGVGGHGYDRNWNHLLVARFRYTAWYAPETGRYIMARHQQWNPSGAPTMDDLIQLLEYRAK
jgi:hypothetical protein